MPGAAVEVAGNFAVLDDATTGPDGSARLRVPADAKVEWVIALKSGRGFDYAEFGPIDEQGRSQGGAPAAELPDSVALTSRRSPDSPHQGGRPRRQAPGRGGVLPWLLHKEGRRSQVNVSSRLIAADDRARRRRHLRLAAGEQGGPHLLAGFRGLRQPSRDIEGGRERDRSPPS